MFCVSQDFSLYSLQSSSKYTVCDIILQHSCRQILYDSKLSRQNVRELSFDIRSKHNSYYDVNTCTTVNTL